MNPNSSSLRKKVAREAASLLYLGVEKEYKQAKLRAAKTVGVNFLPTNIEVAVEIDKIAEENEGPARQERLIEMRKEALKLMLILNEYHPLLVGSVWRGMIHHESDIDIALYQDEVEDILRMLRRKNIKVTQTEWMTVTEKGQKKVSFHIYVESPAKEKAEIIVRSSEESLHRAKCEIYGDEITGLSTKELVKLLKENPVQRFVPF